VIASRGKACRPIGLDFRAQQGAFSAISFVPRVYGELALGSLPGAGNPAASPLRVGDARKLC
jgi:hypothetical protein